MRLRIAKDEPAFVALMHDISVLRDTTYTIGSILQYIRETYSMHHRHHRVWTVPYTRLEVDHEN